MPLYFEWLSLVSIGLLHVVLCPYTKVEESFNMQAIHDILYHQLNITAYDHLQFPGVVSRTFLGAVAVAGPAIPVKLIAQHLDLPKIFMQYIIRLILMFYVLVSLRGLQKAIAKRFGAVSFKIAA